MIYPSNQVNAVGVRNRFQSIWGCLIVQVGYFFVTSVRGLLQVGLGGIRGMRVSHVGVLTQGCLSGWV